MDLLFYEYVALPYLTWPLKIDQTTHITVRRLHQHGVTPTHESIPVYVRYMWVGGSHSPRWSI